MDSDEAPRRTRASGEIVLLDAGVIDPDKAQVMAYFRNLVDSGHAEWRTLDDGSVQLRLNTGETYRLGPKAMTRIA